MLSGDGTLIYNSGTAGFRPIIQLHLVKPFVREKLRFFIAKLNTADLDALTALMESGKLTPLIDHTYPLSEAAKASPVGLGWARPGQEPEHRSTPATQLLDRAASLGRVEGEGSLRLSDEGAALYDRLWAAIRQVQAQRYADMDPSELEITRRVLSEVTRRANELLTV